MILWVWPEGDDNPPRTSQQSLAIPDKSSSSSDSSPEVNSTINLSKEMLSYEAGSEPIVEGIPLDRIWRYFEDNTSAEAELFVERFIGRKAIIVGWVSDGSRSGFDSEPATIYLGKTTLMHGIALRFEQAESDEPLALGCGDVVRALCILGGFDGEISVFFDKCKFVKQTAGE